MTAKEIVLFCRPSYSPFTALARDLLIRYQIPFREVDIQAGSQAFASLITWVSPAHLPTLIVTAPNQTTPLDSPEPLQPDQPARGLDRGSLISQPNNHQLEDWLHKHGFLAKPYKR